MNGEPNTEKGRGNLHKAIHSTGCNESSVVIEAHRSNRVGMSGQILQGLSYFSE